MRYKQFKLKKSRPILTGSRAMSVFLSKVKIGTKVNIKSRSFPDSPNGEIKKILPGELHILLENNDEYIFYFIPYYVFDGNILKWGLQDEDFSIFIKILCAI